MPEPVLSDALANTVQSLATQAVTDGKPLQALAHVAGLALLFDAAPVPTNIVPAAAAGSSLARPPPPGATSVIASTVAARRAYRASLMLSIQSVAQSAAGSPAAVLAAADALEANCAVPAELTDAGQAVALATVETLAAAAGAEHGADGFLVRTLSALSLVATAARLQEISDTVDLLARLDRLDLPFPGMSSSHVAPYLEMQQWNVSLLPTDSQLLLRSFASADGSIAVKPFPRSFVSALSAALGDSPWAMAALTVFGFDVHAAARAVASPSPASVLRLEFGNRTQPRWEPTDGLDGVFFFEAPVKAAASDATEAVCLSWDEDASAWDTGLCRALPNPRPRDHAVFWDANETANLRDHRALAAAWSISGPLYQEADCNEVVFDCDQELRAAASQRRPVTIVANDPANLFSRENPSRVYRCPSGSREVLRFFYGSRCRLWKTQPADNPYNCSWDNSKQKFVGSGCVFDAKASCACYQPRLFRDVRGRTQSAPRPCAAKERHV